MLVGNRAQSHVLACRLPKGTCRVTNCSFDSKATTKSSGARETSFGSIWRGSVRGARELSSTPRRRYLRTRTACVGRFSKQNMELVASRDDLSSRLHSAEAGKCVAEQRYADAHKVQEEMVRSGGLRPWLAATHAAAQPDDSGGIGHCTLCKGTLRGGYTRVLYRSGDSSPAVSRLQRIASALQVAEWERKHKALQRTHAASVSRVEELERELRGKAADIASAHLAHSSFAVATHTLSKHRQHSLPCRQAQKREKLKLGLWMRSLDSSAHETAGAQRCDSVTLGVRWAGSRRKWPH
jgi:hypothetical protein